MKIESILLENFGIYGSKRFRFDGHPLVLIYGANESGKTTALNGLRQALFGFPRQSAYLTGKPMSAEGVVLLSDGRRIRFNRQKKNSDGFIATIDGKIPLAEADWLNLAGGLDLKSYQSLFGFSLDELRSGEKALAHAPIDEALSSSGFGGLARLQKVQHRIEEFLNQSLKRAGLSGSINAKLSEIEEAERHLESVLTLPADVGALRTRVADAQQLVQRYTEQMDALRSRLIICQRQQAALPRAIEYRQVQQSLAEYAIPPAVDDEFRVQWTVANNRLAGARSELVTENRRLEQLEQELAGLPVVQETALLQAEAISLGNQARQVPFWRQQVTDCQREIAELDRELGDSLRKLGWSRQDQRWRSIQLDLNQQAEITGAIQTIDKLTSQLAQCQTRIDVAEKQLHMHRPPQAADADSVPPQGDNALPNPSLSWDRIVEIETQLRALRPLFHNWEQLNRQLQQLRTNRRAVQLADELRAMTSDLYREASSVSSGELNDINAISIPDAAAFIELRTDWQVPTTGEVALRAQRLTATVTECVRLQDQLAALKGQRAALECEIQAVQAGSGIKTL
ncbi:MAG: AAA family ATPase, partial [Pirellulaceae bacterium]|nr:AAA family ATPase [Pirellulaceae bacterium]